MTTRCSPAAQTASSSSCRSSLRGSRSPTSGSRASRSSPSRTVWRGKVPSSRPSRTTTRWGTERIGTSVQTVSAPVRNPALVGRPARAPRSTGRSSTSDSRTSPGPGVQRRRPRSARPAPRPGRRAAGAAATPRRRSWAARRSTDVSSSSAQRGAVRAPAMSRVRRVEPVEELGEAAGEVDVAGVDVVQRDQPAQGRRASMPCPGSTAAPSRMRSMPAPPGPVGDALQRPPRPVLLVQAPPGPALGGPAAQALEGVVVEAEAPGDGGVAREVEHLGGGEPGGAQVEEPVEDGEQRVGLVQGPVGDPHPQPCAPGAARRRPGRRRRGWRRSRRAAGRRSRRPGT